ncbi:autophagy-related protein 2 homolog B-like [Crassostrea virginica]
MPWTFPWTEFLKKRACRYLLQHYLGQFLKEKLSLDQLSVDLYNGRGSIKDLELDVEALNEALDSNSIPLEIIDGFINQISVSVPWTNLIQSSTEMEIQGLEITVQPRQRSQNVGGLETMFNSMCSMTSSLQIAEDCLKSTSDGDQAQDMGTPFEGVQKFAQTIDSVLCRVKVTLIDTVVRVEHLPDSAEKGVALEIKIKRIEYFDDLAKEEGSPVDDTSRMTWEPAAIAHKNLLIDGIQILCDEFSRPAQQTQPGMDSNESSPQTFLSATSSPPCSHGNQSGTGPVTEVFSDPVQIAGFTGKSCLKIKLKQEEGVSGPKVEIELEVGGVHLLLSPNQFHSLLDLVNGFLSPNSGNGSRQRSHSKSKPMSEEDYRKVETELQRQLHSERFHLHHEVATPTDLHDVMTHSFGEEQYFSLAPEQMKDMESSINSNFSLASGRSGSTVTTTRSGPKKDGRVGKDSIQRLFDDPTAELCRYRLRAVFFSVALLHENPSNKVDLDSGTKADNRNNMKTIATQYFQKMHSFSAASGKEVKALRAVFAEALPQDHLRLIGKPVNIEIVERTAPTHHCLTVDLTAGFLDVLECLFNRTVENIAPDYTEILVFPRDVSPRPGQMYSSMHAGAPALKAHVKSVQQNTRSQRGGAGPRTEVCVDLANLECELDVTIIDRIGSLVRPASTNRGYSGNNGATQGGPVYSFSQTLEDESTTDETKVDLSVTCPEARITIRFPIPDLRNGSEVSKLPWWQKNLRDELLVLDLQEARFQTSFLSNQPLQQLELSSRNILASFRIDPNQSAVPFAFVSCEGNDGQEGFNFPQMIIKFTEQTISVLDEENRDSDNSIPLDSLNGACDFEKQDTSPFSTKKHMYGKGEMSDQATQHVSGERVMPGNREDMTDFQDRASAHCLTLVQLALPLVNLYIPDQKFYEVLYNRFSNDLLLWEPMAPAPIVTQEVGPGSIQPFDLSCYTHVLQENFSLAKSAIQYDTSDEEDDSSFGYYSIHDSKHPHRTGEQKSRPSKMCLSLKIDHGKITACTDSKAEDSHGEVMGVVKDANLFVASSYQGNPLLQYICFYCNKATLYHNAAVADKKEEFDIQTLDFETVPGHLEGCCLIQRSEPGVLCHQSGEMESAVRDMVSVAVKVKVDSSPLNDLTRDEKIKEFTVAVGVTGASLRHKMAESDMSWISQMMNFMDVKDYDILGYVTPKILTELHVHLWDCAVDYRPLHLPTRGVVAANYFSISSNIVANSQVSLLRFVLEDAGMYLSQKKKKNSPVDLKKDYVCVLDVESFELELRTSNGKDPKFPKTDLRLRSNKINMRTCSDSCQALFELIQYFANDGDLKAREEEEEGEEEEKRQSLDLEMMTKEESSSDDESKKKELSESRLENLSSHLEEAMQESGSGSDNDGSEGSRQSPNKTEVFFVAPGDRMEGQVPPAGVMRPIIITASADSVTSSAVSERSDIYSDEEEDEDFCIIDDAGLGISPKGGIPEVKIFTSDPIEIKDNHFSQPHGKTDLLKAPDNFPNAEYRYTLKELTIVWFMFGGSDFCDTPVQQKNMDQEVMMSRKTMDYGEYVTEPSIRFGSKGSSLDRIPWQHRGGVGRDHNTLMELQLTKVRFQHEKYPSHTEQASRQVLIISDAEIRDRLMDSKINKFLYQYSSENMPKQTNSNMVYIKAVHKRPDPSVKTEECSLRVSLQPLRLNIDQDSLFFLKKFFIEITGGNVENPVDPDPKQRSRSVSGASGAPAPVITVGQPETVGEEGTPQELLMKFDEMQQSLASHGSVCSTASVSSNDSDRTEQPQPVFIKNFMFSPDVPIRLDYHGKKWVDREHGTLAGVLVGLASLNCSELKLKRLNVKHGLLGLDKLQAYCVNEWITDILKKQLPSILGGVGPMHSFVQIAQGIRDLFWLPVEQYKRDGRLVRGIQRGATSFSTSTAMAMLELTNRAVQSVQYVAEVTYDMVTPGPSCRVQRRRLRGPPADVREGVENAYIAITEGFSNTAYNIMEVATKEHQQKGVTGAVGAAIRLVPPTVLSPVIIATEATSNVLGGMRNQLQPDARKEDEEKWKGNQT